MKPRIHHHPVVEYIRHLVTMFPRIIYVGPEPALTLMSKDDYKEALVMQQMKHIAQMLHSTDTSKMSNGCGLSVDVQPMLFDMAGKTIPVALVRVTSPNEPSFAYCALLELEPVKV